MRNSKWYAMVCLVAAVSLMSCSDDDPEIPSLPTIDEQYVGDVVMGAVSPVIGILDIFINAVDFRKVAEVTCDDIPICTSGSAEICFDDVANTYTATFDQCSVEGEIVDGTVTADVSGLPWTITVNLTVGDVTMSGPIGPISPDPPCMTANWDSLAISGDGASGNMSGSLYVCQEDDWPDGTMALLVSDSGLVVWFYMTINGTPIVETDIVDDQQDWLGYCEVNLETEAVNCEWAGDL